MKLIAEVLAGIAIYIWGGWAVWWVNRRLDLHALEPSITRVSIRVFVLLMVFVMATAPFTYGLRPIFH